MNLAKLPELNENQIKLLTLINIRWVAIIGQFVTISIVYFYFKFSFNIELCYLLVLFSSSINIFLQIRSKKTDLLSNKQATFSVIYDLFQLSGLLFLTGGLTNPFSIFIVAPITIAAGFLSIRSSVQIGFLSILLIIILSIFYFELPGLEKNYLFPKFYILGLVLALCTSIVFLAIYSKRLAMESSQRNDAFNILQQILLREQELKSLGGLAAAAAHELGTPLNTISLVAKELKKEIGSDKKFSQDLDLLISQSQRCSEILKQISKNPYGEKEHKFLDKSSFRILIHEIIDSFKDLSEKKNNLKLFETLGFGRMVSLTRSFIFPRKNKWNPRPWSPRCAFLHRSEPHRHFVRAVFDRRCRTSPTLRSHRVPPTQSHRPGDFASSNR